MASLQKQLEEKNVGFVNYLVGDLKGALKSMEEASVRTEAIATHGFGIDGSSVRGYAKIDHSDVHLRPDMDNFRTFKACGDNFACCFCDVTSPDTGLVHDGDPRGILNRQVEKAKKMGFDVEMMSELEFYVLNKDGTPADSGKYMALPPFDKSIKFRHDLAEVMEDAGFKVKRGHHENGPGQQEIELDLTPAMKNADDTLMGVWLTHLVAAHFDWMATYSPKPLPDEAGSGMHQHVLLRDSKTGKNIFYGDEEGNLSKAALKFIAGMLKYAPEITAVFARSEESYIRLKPGHEAPTLIGWDLMNRSALVRVPFIKNPDKVRVEFRAGDGSGSVHLMAAMILGAGLAGIEEDLPIVAPCRCNMDLLTDAQIQQMGLKRLPTSMTEGYEVIQSSKFLQGVLGQHAVDFFLAEKKAPHGHHDAIQDSMTG